jgi:hypothetical protein
MKTLVNKNGTKFVRVPDKSKHEIQGIEDLLKNGWQFTSKANWKHNCRDVEGKNGKSKKSKSKA